MPNRYNLKVHRKKKCVGRALTGWGHDTLGWCYIPYPQTLGECLLSMNEQMLAGGALQGSAMILWRECDTL